jgi:hypothetical protein
MNDNELNEMKDEFTFFCYAITKNDNKWNFWWKLFENKKEEKFKIYKQKMIHMIDLLNEDDSKIMSMDIQNELYDLL